MVRTVILLGLVGCLNQAAQVVNPSPEGGGTQTCREIVETCDKECTQIMCLHACTNNGTTEAAAQHDALLSCGQNNGCTDEDCMRTNCGPQIDTCMGPEPTPSAEATTPTAQPPDQAPPVEQPPTAPTE